MSTLADLVQRTILRLHQTTGAGVQKYAEDVIAEMIEHKFFVLFDMYWWDRYKYRATTTLDAVGQPVQDWSALVPPLRGPEDIRFVWYETNRDPLTEFDEQINDTNVSNGCPLYIERNGTASMFRVLPYGTAGDEVHVMYRARPLSPLQPTDDLLLDEQALILGTCYDYLADKGTNVNAEAKFLRMFEQRMVQIKRTYSQGSVSLRGRIGQPHRWTAL